MPGARQFRQTLSDSRQLASGDPQLLLEALSRSPLAA
jgi:tRNA-dihydrouridine synthase A